MKRADHHNVSPVLPSEENLDEMEDKKEQMQSEQLVPHHTEAPSMGALPIDSLGSRSNKDDWNTTALDESHASNADNDNDSEDEIIAVGVGPDPENIQE